MPSRTADIDFTFVREVTVRSTVSALIRGGWSLEEPLGLSYMVNDDDMYDWLCCAPDQAGEVLTLLDSPENKGYTVAVCIYHPSAETGGQLLFAPDRTKCSFIPTINRRGLPSAPKFTDVAWYLQTLVPTLVHEGLHGYEATEEGF